jgi:hypothetical protein
VPEERIQALRTKLRDLQREPAGVQDDAEVLEALGRHLDQLLQADRERR